MTDRYRTGEHIHWVLKPVVKHSCSGLYNLLLCWVAFVSHDKITLTSLSIQYKQKPLYFCTSNISHQCGLITTHCTDAIPPAAHMSLCDHSLMLWLQVTLFTQQHFNLGLSVLSLGYSQQFRWCLFEPAAIHRQQHSQNLAENALPSSYYGDISVLIIVLYCIMIATVGHLICPVTGMASHATHCTAQLLSQVACLYSSLFSHSTSPLMRTQFYLQITMPCGSWWNCHVACVWHSILYLITVLTIWKASISFPSRLQVWKPLWKTSISFVLSDLLASHFVLLSPSFTLCFVQCSSPCALPSPLWLCSLFVSPPSYL